MHRRSSRSQTLRTPPGPLDPEAAFLHHGSQITVIAWDLQYGKLLEAAYGKPMPPCPNCKEAACVQAKGWADPRRVVDHNKVVFLSSRRFRCTTGKPHAWGLSWLTWSA
jgi:hypothetical protein